ncbi:hypothetical protein L207DRAFT_319222 [Hyaloscypha variabilis F]|jgi:hypothetical protein|uniref:Secreted protein n=1 Tax=Hyaloscypha variabilis (strain UAMH 11265 / GT02V1 / F) TaxID=1149755 RepID=A0A2J6RW64_HYAVF|nr:hypothetical protein L207DRAFT_319222 [Hyaloscypha variabilis F]
MVHGRAWLLAAAAATAAARTAAPSGRSPMERVFLWWASLLEAKGGALAEAVLVGRSKRDKILEATRLVGSPTLQRAAQHRIGRKQTRRLTFDSGHPEAVGGRWDLLQASRVFAALRQSVRQSQTLMFRRRAADWLCAWLA